MQLLPQLLLQMVLQSIVNIDTSAGYRYIKLCHIGHLDIDIFKM